MPEQPHITVDLRFQRPERGTRCGGGKQRWLRRLQRRILLHLWSLNQNMNQRELLSKLEKSWAGFKESYSGLTDAQMTQPGVTGDWSVKDILAHVSWWEEEALKHLPHILQGIRPPRYSVLYGGIDAFNAQMTELKRHLSLAEVTRQIEETHDRLLQYLRSVPEDQFISDSRFRRRLRLDTYSHYPIHAQAIREWRKRQAETTNS